MPDSSQNSPEFSPIPATSAAVSYTPQFTKAEYTPPPGTVQCTTCSAILPSQYFVVNGTKVCAACAQQALDGQPAGTHANFVRAIFFGIGGAIAGLLVYAAVTIATGWTIGYLALGVGWIVAKAILYGSRGIGGRPYQIVAVVLTYAAISSASVPVILYDAYAHPELFPNWVVLLNELLLYSVASPFLQFGRSPFGGVLGLIILFVGLRIAWQLTRGKRIEVKGPYAVINSPQL